MIIIQKNLSAPFHDEFYFIRFFILSFINNAEPLILIKLDGSQILFIDRKLYRFSSFFNLNSA